MGLFGTLAVWDGVAQTAELRKHFFPQLTRVLDAGETFRVFDWVLDFDLPLVIEDEGQSNAEGRASLVIFLRWVRRIARRFSMSYAHLTGLIAPWPPISENASGPNPTEENIGLSQCLAVLYAAHTGKPVTLVGTSSGSQSIRMLYGTTGFDGSWGSQIDDLEVCGAPSLVYPPIIRNQRRLRVFCLMEHDSAASINPTLPTHWRPMSRDLLQLSTARFPRSPVTAQIILRHPATNPNNPSTHPWWPYLRDEETLLAQDLNASGTPCYVVDVREIDRKIGDTLHFGIDEFELYGFTYLAWVAWRMLRRDGIL